VITARLLTLALPLLVLAGCAATAPETAAPVAPVAPATPAARAATEPLTPAEQEFVDRLATVDAALAAKPERSVGRGENICADLRSDAPADKLATNAADRFTGDDVQLSADQGAKIVEAARETLCAGA
jgi:hypothetical protein